MKLLWCRWWTAGCAVMSYLAAVARCDCFHLLQVVSTSDRATSTQTLWAQAKSSLRPFTAIITSLHHPGIKPIHQTSRRGTDSLSPTQTLCSIQSQTQNSLYSYRLNSVTTRCNMTLQHVINVIFSILDWPVVTKPYIFAEWYLADSWWTYQPRRASRMQAVQIFAIL